MAEEAGVDRRGRLLDVGCGPGILAIRLARLFDAVVALDPDADMLTEGTKTRSARDIARQAEALGANLDSGAGLESSSVTLNVMPDKLEYSPAAGFRPELANRAG